MANRAIKNECKEKIHRWDELNKVYGEYFRFSIPRNKNSINFIEEIRKLYENKEEGTRKGIGLLLLNQPKYKDILIKKINSLEKDFQVSLQDTEREEIIKLLACDEIQDYIGYLSCNFLQKLLPKVMGGSKGIPGIPLSIELDITKRHLEDILPKYFNEVHQGWVKPFIDRYREVLPL